MLALTLQFLSLELLLDLTSQATLRYKATMNTIRRSIATLELLLVCPASLFMLALFLRAIQPPQYQPAQTARLVVDWFAARPHVGLDLCLIALPFIALIIGCLAVLRAWRTDAQLRESALQTLAAIRANFSALLIAAATLVAGGILSIVALHIVTD